MIFIYSPKQLKLSSPKQLSKLKGISYVEWTYALRLQSWQDVVQRLTKVGAPGSLSGGPSAVTNIPVVHTLLIAVQPTFDLESKEPLQRMRRMHSVTEINNSFDRKM